MTIYTIMIIRRLLFDILSFDIRGFFLQTLLTKTDNIAKIKHDFDFLNIFESFKLTPFECLIEVAMNDNISKKLKVCYKKLLWYLQVWLFFIPGTI